MITLLRNGLLKAIFILTLVGVFSSAYAVNVSATYVSGSLNNQNQPNLFNMVPNSIQQIKFLIYPTISQNVNFKCSMSTNPLDSFTGLGGCVNGAGTLPNQPYPLVITIRSGSAAGPVTHTLTLSDLSGRSSIQVTLNYTIVSNSQRTVTFQNYCPFPVYFGIASGTMPPKSGSSCATSANCPAGTQCTGGKCFWIVPTPNTAAGTPQATYLLAAYTSGQPASNSITISDYSATNNSNKLWSGGFAARTGCSFSGGGVITCTTGDCGDDGLGKGGCEFGKSFTAPVTQAEVTFLVNQPDSYDATVINGFNIPVTFTPNVPVGTNNPYDCGTPGSTTAAFYTDKLYSTTNPAPTGQLSACNWNFSPPSLYYQWVDDSTATGCASNSACAPNACGLSKTNINGNNATLHCGKLLGYWSQDQFCVVNSSYNQAGIVNCTSKAMIGNCTANGNTCPVTVNNQYTFTNLLACTSAPPDAQDNTLTFASCFAKGAYSSSNCCGCNNWQVTGGMTGVIPTDPQLVAQCGTGANTVPNQNWYNNVLSNLVFLKNACPSAYTYPYDDKSSSFNCPYRYEQGQSAVNYTVTFCPGGKTGGVTPLT